MRPPQDRGDDHHAGSTVEHVVEHREAAESQQRVAHGELPELGGGIEAAGRVRGLRLHRQHNLLSFHPRPVNIPEHAHRFNDLGIAQGAVCVLLGRNGRHVGCHQGGAGGPLIEPGQSALHDGANDRRPSEQGAHGKDQHQKNQCGREFHRGQNRGRRKKLAKGAKVLHGLRRSPGQFLQVGLERQVEKPCGHQSVQRIAGTVHDGRARPVEELHHDIRPHHQHGQHQERHVAAAVDDTVIDFKHVGTWSQHEQTGQQAEPGRPHKIRAQLRDGVAEFRWGGEA
jgi:hypothetical protein